MRSAPVDEPTFFTMEGRPQAKEYTVMMLLYKSYHTELWFIVKKLNVSTCRNKTLMEEQYIRYQIYSL